MRPREAPSAPPPTLAVGLHPESEGRLWDYLMGTWRLLGDKRRREGFASYACGLLGDGERKSVEPIACRSLGQAADADARHRKLLRVVGESTWDDASVRQYAARYALEAMQSHGAVRHWIVDDTGFLKQGTKSPGVQRQYTGSAGKITNCQIGVSLTLANEVAHVPVDMRLYLPESWSQDRERCRAAKIPDEVTYQAKWKLALDMLEAAVIAEHPRGIVLADADYGDRLPFRDGLDALGLEYAVGVQRDTHVRRVTGAGATRAVGPRMSVEELAFTLEPREVRRVSWREGAKQTLSARFAVIRVEPVLVDGHARQEQWLIIEWPGQHMPRKYALSTMPRRCARKHLIRTLKERWRTERAYQDLKGELGLDHFEGRSYLGWNHHVSLVFFCYAFLVAEQARAFPPSRVWRRCPADYDAHACAA